jgi:hypothetical protein
VYHGQKQKLIEYLHIQTLILDDKLYGIGRKRDKTEFIAFETSFKQGEGHAIQIAYFEVEDEITEMEFQVNFMDCC